MATLKTDGEFPKRAGEYLFYRLHDKVVVRTVSGFTTAALKTDPKYQNCRAASGEFGAVSRSCKWLRMALKGILPAYNNLAVVNGLTKKMLGLLPHDPINAKGQRQLLNVFATPTGRAALQGYQFNPAAVFDLDFALANNEAAVGTARMAAGAHDWVGFRAHLLDFDFGTGASQLISGDWGLYGTGPLPPSLVLPLPAAPDGPKAVRLTLIETAFFEAIDQSWRMVEEGKGIVVVGVG